MSPEGLLTRSRPLRGNLSGAARGAPCANTMLRRQEALSGTVPCEVKHAASCIPRQQPPPLGLAPVFFFFSFCVELLLLLLHSLRGLGVLGGCIPCGKAGSLRGLRRVGALGMQRPWGAWSSDGA